MVRGSVAVDISCAICGAVAMHVESTAPGDPPLSARRMPEGTVPVPTTSAGILTEAGTLNLWRAVDERKAGIDEVRGAIESGRVAALMDIHPEIVPFYCRDCEASYCETHWTDVARVRSRLALMVRGAPRRVPARPRTLHPRLAARACRFGPDPVRRWFVRATEATMTEVPQQETDRWQKRE